MKSSSDMILPRQQARHRRLVAHHDELTGLPDQVLFGDRLRKAIAHSKRWGQLLAVVRLDLEGLGAINDQYGRQIGDQAMTTLAREMKRTLRKGEVLARLNGAGFAALLPDLENLTDCVPAINRLLEVTDKPVICGDALLNVSSYIGLSFYPQEEDADGEKLLRQASQALRRARLAGKNCYYFFDPTQEHSPGGDPENLENIRQAMAAREFVLHYQPKVNMSTGTVVGAEALIRWQHPQLGLLSPAEFLPVIQDHPLAVDLGEWVIGTALTQREEWLDAGLDIPVSVNVAPRQLMQPGFVDRLQALLAQHPRIHPSSLELDILETGALEDVAQLSGLLTKCRETGISFALDDFGTGHCSLSDLKQLPIDVLKIDPSFVRDILENPDDLMILEGVLGLVLAFHRQPVAEGVETVEQGLMLLRMGCEQAQGYGIAQPMMGSEIPAWAAAWRPDPRWSETLTVSIDDRPLLHAGVEHRAWVAEIEAFLKGESDKEPRVSRHQCQFGAWLYAEGPAGRSSHPGLQAIVALHWRIHALAAGIMKFYKQSRNEEGLARLGELRELVDKLADMLNAYGRKGETEPAVETSSEAA